MKRKSFLKSLLGLLAAPFLPRVRAVVRQAVTAIPPPNGMYVVMSTRMPIWDWTSGGWVMRKELRQPIHNHPESHNQEGNSHPNESL